jgi:urease accessory protein
MQRATSVVRKLAVKSSAIVDRITLDHGGRHRRRMALQAEGGTEFLLDLDKAVALKGGDALKLEDGRLVEVVAAAEALLEIRAETTTRLARIAWHIGNRHTPAEITDDAIFIERDAVLAEMVRGQGGIVTVVSRPFEPERGAYEGGGHGHGHDHLVVKAVDVTPAAAHSHDHEHDHAGHVHGPGCGHDHNHIHAPADTHDHAHDQKHDHGHDHGHTHAKIE